MASGYADKVARHMSGVITNAHLSNGWTTNGQCFWEITDDVCRAHYTIRNGTATDGTVVHKFGGGFESDTNGIAIILSSTGVNGWAIYDHTTSEVKVYGISTVGSVIFDICWVLTNSI